MALVEFAPSRWFNTIGTHEPVCYRKPGDVVRTRTVDAGGADHQGATVAGRPNPMTGPFHVEGAEPGDALVMHLIGIRPDRSTGWTRNILAGDVLDPDYLQGLPVPSPAITVWDVDTSAGLVRVSDGEGLPWQSMDPMIGCFGVAPAGGEAISTATPGPHGGNMDYRGWRDGVTALFPVSVPGALLYLGDVHALQGDGEIVGTGIEISAEVEFSVDVVKNQRLSWPRGYNDSDIFVAGSARPLDQATRHATTEVSRWLVDECGYDLETVHLMMGQQVRYDLGNIYDPAYTMVCRLSRAMLADWNLDPGRTGLVPAYTG